MLTVDEARKRNVCRICEKHIACGPVTLDKKEYAHTQCLENICPVCNKHVSNNFYWREDRRKMHIECVDVANKDIIALEEARKQDICRVCHRLVYDKENYLHGHCIDKFKKYIFDQIEGYLKITDESIYKIFPKEELAQYAYKIIEEQYENYNKGARTINLIEEIHKYIKDFKQYKDATKFPKEVAIEIFTKSLQDLL